MTIRSMQDQQSTKSVSSPEHCISYSHVILNLHGFIQQNTQGIKERPSLKKSELNK